MVKAMKYRIKNESLAKLISLLFDEQDLQKQIEEQFKDNSNIIALCSKGEEFITKLNPEYEEIKNAKGHVSFFISKEEIEGIKQIPEYEPDKWNLYPEIKPPKEGRYLIQSKIGNNPYFYIGVWDKKNPWYGNLVFRDLPDPYEGEELKEDVTDWEI